MDFLDPKRKKSHRRRLLLGYLLMAVAVAMGTLILLFSAYGFDINRKTGDVIQNGTVFVDSQPAGSNITLNGTPQGSRTASRLVLPGSQQYTISLSQAGYRDWNRTFSLEGGKIERLVYPLMLPSKLITTEAQLYASAPAISSQSPDRRWLLIEQPGQVYGFDLYDLNNPSSAPTTLTIPANILTEADKPASLNVVEWSNDNKHVLIERAFNNGVTDTHEFLMIDTTQVASSININTTLTVSPAKISLRDKKPDLLYMYDSTGGILRLGDLKNRTVSGALLSNILAYKSYGTELLLYATREGAAAGKTNLRIRENDKATYLLKSVPDSPDYLLDIAESDGTPYYVVGSSQDDAVFVYRDPLPTLKGQSQFPLFVSAVLRITAPKFVSFSQNTKFIVAQSGNKLVLYDIEADRQYKLGLNHEIGSKLAWMDGFRFSFVDKSISFMVDFDGSNEQAIVPSLVANGPYFAPDFKTVFSLADSKVVSGRFALTQTSLVKK
ncbi:hypothetical protein BH10PAT3_BH10PAT3_2310 [soil metagenome]